MTLIWMGFEISMILYMALRDYYDISYHIPSISINFTTSPAETSLFSIVNPPNDFTKFYRMKLVPRTPPFVKSEWFLFVKIETGNHGFSHEIWGISCIDQCFLGIIWFNNGILHNGPYIYIYIYYIHIFIYIYIYIIYTYIYLYIYIYSYIKNGPI